MQESAKIHEKAKTIIAKKLAIESSSFEKDGNIFIEDDNKFFEIVSFGRNAILIGDKRMIEWSKEKHLKIPARDILDGSSLYEIEEQLRKYNRKFLGEHLSFVYTKFNNELKQPSGFRYVLYDQISVKQLKKDDRFSNALNYKSDVIAYGALENERLIAIAGADNYYKDMWQIGIDVLPSFRGKGLATYLVKTLADEITRNDKIAYYTTWSANIASMKVALSAGFTTGWVRYYSN